MLPLVVPLTATCLLPLLLPPAVDLEVSPLLQLMLLLVLSRLVLLLGTRSPEAARLLLLSAAASAAAAGVGMLPAAGVAAAVAAAVLPSGTCSGLSLRPARNRRRVLAMAAAASAAGLAVTSVTAAAWTVA
jgi:hypothetical protein